MHPAGGAEHRAGWMPELDNLWEYYHALIQRLRLHVDAAPFTTGPDGFSPDDESLLYALREGLVNLESHSDFFAPMHPTIRVYDNRIEFQNPGRFIRGLEHLRDTISSTPRNPVILKLFRYAKLSENAGYGIDKIYSWERLTGERVEFTSDIMSTTVAYWRPKVGSTVKRSDKSSEGSNGTTPTISKAELAELCDITTDGVRYHLKYIKKETGVYWEGYSINGHWVFPDREKDYR